MGQAILAIINLLGLIRATFDFDSQFSFPFTYALSCHSVSVMARNELCFRLVWFRLGQCTGAGTVRLSMCLLA